MAKFTVDVNDKGEIIHAEPYVEPHAEVQADEAEPAPRELSDYVGTGIVGGAVVLGVIILLFGAFFIVRQQTVIIVERLGRFLKVARAGLNFKIPFIDRKVGVLSLKVQEIQKVVDVKSKDNAFLEVPVKVQYQVLDESVQDAFYRLENPDRISRGF